MLKQHKDLKDFLPHRTLNAAKSVHERIDELEVYIINGTYSEAYAEVVKELAQIYFNMFYPQKVNGFLTTMAKIANDNIRVSIYQNTVFQELVNALTTDVVINFEVYRSTIYMLKYQKPCMNTTIKVDGNKSISNAESEFYLLMQKYGIIGTFYFIYILLHTFVDGDPALNVNSIAQAKKYGSNNDQNAY